MQGIQGKIQEPEIVIETPTESPNRDYLSDSKLQNCSNNTHSALNQHKDSEEFPSNAYSIRNAEDQGQINITIQKTKPPLGRSPEKKNQNQNYD